MISLSNESLTVINDVRKQFSRRNKEILSWIFLLEKSIKISNDFSTLSYLLILMAIKSHPSQSLDNLILKLILEIRINQILRQLWSNLVITPHLWKLGGMLDKSTDC